LIEAQVQSRGIDNIRSHAQKFLARLLKFIEGDTTIEEMRLEEAQYYFGILNVRLHKTIKMKKQKKQREEEEAKLEKEREEQRRYRLPVLLPA